MKTTTPEISWHGRDPIYSVDFQFIKDDIQRIATCGTDRNVRIWEVKVDRSGKAEVEFLASLQRHTRTVNVVRFSPCGTMLASAGDDSAIMIWRLNESSTAPNIFGDEEAEEQRETWSVVRALRSHLEDVYDLSWGADGNTLMSGSVDNSAIYWDVRKGVRIAMFPDHKSFVQGVAVDPRGLYLATLSADRHCRIYNTQTKNCLHTVSKVNLPVSNNNKDGDKSEQQYQTFKMFHDDTMKSFFRRLTFSPDGQLLIVPAGCIEQQDQTTANVSYVFSRTDLTKPVLQLPAAKTATLAVRCCPILFTLKQTPRTTPLPPKTESTTPNEDGDKSDKSTGPAEWEKYETLFCLPYRMVFAVASEDAVLLYDTQQPLPFAYVSNIHYHTLSDISWSADGRTLAVASTDGFVTFVTFQAGELGETYSEQVITMASRADITRREEERNAERQRKKKAKEEARKQTAAKIEGAPSEEMKQETKPSEKVPSTSTEKDTVEKMETDCSEAPNPPSAPSTPSTSNSQSSNKTPRRVKITTLQSPSCKPDSAAAVLKNSENMAETLSKPGLDSPKTPRRVGIKTLQTFNSPSTSSPMSQNVGKSPASAKKRVQVTTLETFTEKVTLGTEDSTDTTDLHLVLETTLDNDDDDAEATPTPTPSSSSTTTDPSLVDTPKSSSKKQPRRVNITTLQPAAP